jgi:uncharacterized protein YndB with AHSA1/START domain
MGRRGLLRSRLPQVRGRRRAETSPYPGGKGRGPNRRVKRTSDGSIGAGSTFEWKMKFMGTHQVQFEVKEFVPGRPEVITAVSRGPLMPTFTYTFEPVAEGTRFIRHGDIRVGGIMKLIEPMMKMIAPKHMQGLLEKLKLVLEAER